MKETQDSKGKKTVELSQRIARLGPAAAFAALWAKIEAEDARREAVTAVLDAGGRALADKVSGEPLPDDPAPGWPFDHARWALAQEVIGRGFEPRDFIAGGANLPPERYAEVDGLVAGPCPFVRCDHAARGRFVFDLATGRGLCTHCWWRGGLLDLYAEAHEVGSDEALMDCAAKAGIVCDIAWLQQPEFDA